MSRSSRWLAMMTAALITTTGFSYVVTNSSADAAPAENLVQNASLEDGDGNPTCFSRSGWGSEGVWEYVLGRGGGRAVSIQIDGYQQGDRKLLQTESLDCAPAVEPGKTYEMQMWYQSTIGVSLTMFRHTAEGWRYWGEVSTHGAADGWTLVNESTPVIPEDTDALAFGLSLADEGTLVTDDYSLRETSAAVAPEPTDELIVNADLAAGNGMPECFESVGWGDRQVVEALSADAPPGSTDGARAFELTVSGHAGGDAKLIQSAAAGCAPAVTPGTTYDLSVDYTSTANNNSITVFTHTAQGWQYWTDLKALPPTGEWATAQATTPEIPDGVDRISFGVSLFANGTLKTTNYSMKQVKAVAPPPAGGAADLIGSWDIISTELPIRAIHTTLLHDGRLLLIAGSGNDENLFKSSTFEAVVWSPDTNEFKDIEVPYDMFCAGHVTLADGKVLVAGGTEAFPTNDQGPTTFKGSDQSYYFDPEDDQFHKLSDMAGAHWYPSLTKLGNGDIWAAGGLDEKAEGTVLTEMFDYSSMSWLPQGNVPQTWSYWGTYPHMFLLDDGKMFYTGAHTFGNGLPGTGASLYDWTTAQIWDVPGLRQKDMRDQASSVFVGPAQDQKLMIVGGGNTNANVPAINLVDIIDFNTPNPAYVPGPDLPGPGKTYANLVNLPDRTVLSANGARQNRAEDVYTAAVYHPDENVWQSIDPDPVGRNYHSTSILLPDGRVAIMGSNPGDNSFELRISVYSPPYLFRGDRPQIAAAPDAAAYGDTFQLKVEGDVTAASLMAPMSSTHQTDTNARLVDLPLTGGGDTRTAQVPDNPNLLPPGPYMLTVLDSAGVPSIAEWVWIS